MNSNDHKDTETYGTFLLSCPPQFLDQIKEQLYEEVKARLLKDLSMDNALIQGRYVNTKEAAHLLGMPVSRLHDAVSKGVIVPDAKDGQQHRFKVSTLEAYMSKGGHRRQGGRR